MTVSTKSASALTTANFISSLCELTEDYTMPVQQVLLLLALYNHGELAQQELVKYTGVARSSNSRNIAKLGIGDSPWAANGPGWVESYEDPMDRRNKMVRLTPKGVALLKTAVERAVRP